MAFCSLLGYRPAVVLSWLKGDALPQGAEVLNIAGTLDPEVYKILGLGDPDPELLKIYRSFSHLTGEYRSRLSLALWEAENEIRQTQSSPNTPTGKAILARVFNKWGIDQVNGQSIK